MEKLDLKKALKTLYNPSAKEVSVVDVPAMNFGMIDGAGDPNTSPEFQNAIEALYGISYTLRFMLKKRGGYPHRAVFGGRSHQNRPGETENHHSPVNAVMDYQ